VGKVAYDFPSCKALGVYYTKFLKEGNVFVNSSAEEKLSHIYGYFSQILLLIIHSSTYHSCAKISPLNFLFLKRYVYDKFHFICLNIYGIFEEITEIYVVKSKNQ